MNRAIAYKCLQPLADWDAPKWYSYSVFARARVFYQAGQWASAPPALARAGYHITVFSGYHNAKWFLHNFSSVGFTRSLLWVGVADGVVGTRDIPKFLSQDNIYHLLDGGDPTLLQSQHSWNWPAGTKMASRFMPIKRMSECPGTLEARTCWKCGAAHPMALLTPGEQLQCGNCKEFAALSVAQFADFLFEQGHVLERPTERKVRDWLRRKDGPKSFRGPGKGRGGALYAPLSEAWQWCPPIQGRRA